MLSFFGENFNFEEVLYVMVSYILLFLGVNFFFKRKKYLLVYCLLIFYISSFSISSWMTFTAVDKSNLLAEIYNRKSLTFIKAVLAYLFTLMMLVVSLTPAAHFFLKVKSTPK